MLKTLGGEEIIMPPAVRSFFRALFGRGRFKMTVPLLIGVVVYDHFVPGSINLWLTYVWKEFFSPMMSLLIMLLIMWWLLKAACNALMGKKKWF